MINRLSRLFIFLSVLTLIQFEISGPAEIVATDNGDPADLVAFPSKERKAYSGLALAIVRPKKGSGAKVTITARSNGLATSTIVIKTM